MLSPVFEMRLTLSLVLMLVGWLGASPALGGSDVTPQPTKVWVGVFLNSVPQLNLQSNEVTIDAYIWFRWDPKQWPPPEIVSGDAATRDRMSPTRIAAVSGSVEPSAANPQGATAEDSLESKETKQLGPESTFEVIGSTEDSVKTIYDRLDEGYSCVQWKGKCSNHWDVQNYPFDRQQIRLVIEDATHDERQVLYVADTVNCGFARDIRVTGCTVQGIETGVETYVYPTNFGDPNFASDTQNSYSRFIFILHLHRDGWGLFFKLFTPLLVSTFVAMLAFWINPTQVDPRFGLCVGGLFGIIASSYAMTVVLPDTGEPCYADRLHQAGLLVILIAVVESVGSLALHLNMGERGARIAHRLDRVSAVVVGSGFVIATIWLTAQASAFN